MQSFNETLELKKGQTLYHKGTPVKQMAFLKSGHIQAKDDRVGFLISEGQIAGILDVAFDTYNFSYIATEETTVVLIPYSGAEDLEMAAKSYNQYTTGFVKQITGYINEYLAYLKIFVAHSEKLTEYIATNFKRYHDICNENQISPLPFASLDILDDNPNISTAKPFTVSYYQGISHMPKNVSDAYYKCCPAAAAHIIFEASNFIISLINDVQAIKSYVFELRNQLINERCEDFFQAIADLAFTLTRSACDVREVIKLANELANFLISSKLYDVEKTTKRLNDFKIELSEVPVTPVSFVNTSDKKEHISIDKDNATKLLTNSIDTIIRYAGISIDECNDFKSLVHTYKNFRDRSDTSDLAMKTRKEITKLFYDIYEKTLFKAIIDRKVPTIISMFLNFGYIDEELIGMDNALMIYEATENIHELNSKHVFTIFEWFKAIYSGKRDPSKNDFDLDYPAYLRDEKKNGNITATEANEYLLDMDKRLHFEMRNFFTSANRITCGRISTFCPLLSDDLIIKPLEVSLLSANKIEEALAEIISIDYSAFYREVLYTDPAHGIEKEFIQQEILPDIILFPNSGVKGHMWQELGNSKRNTPARFAMPVILQEGLQETLVGLVGRYRWEICRRIQGARWNDLSEKSLTAEYCDYTQFYRKNRDLSDQAKEKLKTSLQKARNNSRELFAKDYEQWILYESKGAARLNKVARKIIFTYCPFSKEYRTSLAQSPMFRELLERYVVQIANKKKHAEAINLKITKNGGTITPPLEKNLEFFDL